MFDLAFEYGKPHAEQGDRRYSSSPYEVQVGRTPLPTPPSPGHASPTAPHELESSFLFQTLVDHGCPQPR
jgi:hypothetical protein